MIEGIDGVGKSTCSRILAKMLSGYYYETPSFLFKKFRDRIDRLKKFNIRFLFYLFSVFYSSLVIRKLLKKKPVICDRYIYSTLAYHRAMGVKLSFKTNINRLPITLPDLCVYLWANNQTCAQRIANRKINPTDKFLEENREFQSKTHQEFAKFPMKNIDTSKLTPKEVCNKIIELLRGDFN